MLRLITSDRRGNGSGGQHRGLLRARGIPQGSQDEQ